MQFNRRRHYFNITQERVVMTIYSEPCQPKSLSSLNNLTAIFTNLVADPRLMQCDDAVFDNCRITHDGNCWVMTMEALVPRREFQV